MPVRRKCRSTWSLRKSVSENQPLGNKIVQQNLIVVWPSRGNRLLGQCANRQSRIVVRETNESGRFESAANRNSSSKDLLSGGIDNIEITIEGICQLVISNESEAVAHGKVVDGLPNPLAGHDARCPFTFSRNHIYKLVFAKHSACIDRIG